MGRAALFPVGGAVENLMPRPDYATLFAPLGLEVRLNEPLQRYTAARLGGAADALVVVTSALDLDAAARVCWSEGLPMRILGGGANVLISDQGYRGAILINDAKTVTLEDEGRVIAESGAGLISLTRRCIERGLGGLEWAINVPGTVGGAVVNNAGAHGGDTAGLLWWAEISEPNQLPQHWTADQMGYRYRESALKHRSTPFAVLRAAFHLNPGCDPNTLNAHAEEFSAHRKRTQPPGASLGSMFKNPPGDYAGRLIEAAGLKGTRIGGVVISPLHANFFVNTGGGTASDYYQLIRLAQRTVEAQFGIRLELEVELIGAWDETP